jgi:hypothetical protein
MMFESIAEKDFPVYLITELDNEVLEENVEDLVEKVKNIPIHFATIDLGYIDTRKFNDTYLAKALKKFDVPYFAIELPHYVKGHYASQVSEIQNKYEELKSTYDSLNDKNVPSAQELRYLIDYYSNELMELKYHINQKVRTTTITKRILEVVKDRDEKELTFVHFGEENTFVEIMRQLNSHNVKSKFFFMNISEFIEEFK